MWVALVLLGPALWTATPVPLNDTPSLTYDLPTTAVSAPESAVPATPDEVAQPAPIAPRIDLYGNDIEEAVTEYRIDIRGDVYERHAPDTAVTKLGPAGV